MTATWGAPTYESRCHLQLSQPKQLLHSTLKNLSPQQRPHGAAATAALPCHSPKRAKLKCSKEAPWDMFWWLYLSGSPPRVGCIPKDIYPKYSKH